MQKFKNFLSIYFDVVKVVLGVICLISPMGLVITAQVFFPQDNLFYLILPYVIVGVGSVVGGLIWLRKRPQDYEMVPVFVGFNSFMIFIFMALGIASLYIIGIHKLYLLGIFNSYVLFGLGCFGFVVFFGCLVASLALGVILWQKVT